MSYLISAFLLILFLTGCSPLTAEDESFSKVEVQLSTDPEYRDGQEVLLRLTNLSARTINYNLCPAGVQAHKSDGWVDIGVPKAEDLMCTGELRSLAAGQTATYEWGRLREDLASGTYRFRTTVGIAPEYSMRHVTSNVFTVGE